MLIKDFIALSKEEREQITTPLDFSNQRIGERLYDWDQIKTLNAFCEVLGQCRQVPEINLSDNNLVSSSLEGLQGALSKCKSLKSLILRGESYSMYYPSMLGELISQCSALESLDLSGAKLGWDLELALKDCPKLNVLILRENLAGSVDFFLQRLASLLPKACPQLQILDISEDDITEQEQYLNQEISQLIVLNKNLYELRIPTPLTPTQRKLLKNRLIQHAVKRAEEIATETDFPTDLTLLTLQYDDTLSRHVDEKTVPLIKDGLKRPLSLKYALAMKKRWDVAKIFSLTIVSLVLTLTFAAYLFSGLALLMSSIGAAMISTLVFKTCKNFMDKRNNDLLATLTLEPSMLEDDDIESVQLEKAFNDGKQSVKSWAPYLRYYSDKRSETYRQYWDKGQAEGLIDVYAPANRVAP